MGKVLALRNRIYVPASFDGDGAVIVPERYLGRHIVQRRRKGNPLTARQHQKFNPPDLGVLRRAYFDKNDDGSWLCPEYRDDVLSNMGYGEWTSTWIDINNGIIYQNPVFDKHGNVLGAEKTIKAKGHLPPSGHVLEYDKETGIPSRTGSREQAQEIFGDDASYVYFGSGLCAVLRDFISHDGGPFYVDASYRLDYGDRSVGSRLSSGSEQISGQTEQEKFAKDQKYILEIEPQQYQRFLDDLREGTVSPDLLRMLENAKVK